MKRTTLVGWLLALGVSLWLSGRVVESQPAFAAVAGLAALVFFAVAARPSSN